MDDSKDKGKEVRVLTSEGAKKNGAVDPNRQVSKEELKQKFQLSNSRIERGETSRPRVTSHILLNKWQRQQEKEYYQQKKFINGEREFAEEHRRFVEERRKYEEEQSHWGCSFFRHCWNEGLKLLTRNNCPECSEQYYEYRQSRANRRSVHERLGTRFLGDDLCFKFNGFENQRRKRLADQYWTYHIREEAQEYVWQKGQWCPPELRKSQKRRVQRLRNTELKQVESEKKKKLAWQPKKKSDDNALASDACMAFFLPSESIAPEDQNVQEEVYSDFDENEFQDLMAQLVLTQKAVFDKPVKHRHLKPLYLRGYVNGKPLAKMLVDGGVAINIMPYTTFRKLGMEDGDLLKIDMILRDFAGNRFDTRGAVHVELLIGSETLITTFFVIDGKGAYSMLLGRDWIHANCCIPSTMH